MEIKKTLWRAFEVITGIILLLGTLLLGCFVPFLCAQGVAVLIWGVDAIEPLLKGSPQERFMQISVSVGIIVGNFFSFCLLGLPIIGYLVRNGEAPKQPLPRTLEHGLLLELAKMMKCLAIAYIPLLDNIIASEAFLIGSYVPGDRFRFCINDDEDENEAEDEEQEADEEPNSRDWPKLLKESKHEGIATLLELKFGTNGLGMMEQIRKIENLEQLTQVQQMLKQVPSLSAFQGWLSQQNFL